MTMTMTTTLMVIVNASVVTAKIDSTNTPTMIVDTLLMLCTSM